MADSRIGLTVEETSGILESTVDSRLWCAFVWPDRNAPTWIHVAAACRGVGGGANPPTTRHEPAIGEWSPFQNFSNLPRRSGRGVCHAFTDLPTIQRVWDKTASRLESSKLDAREGRHITGRLGAVRCPKSPRL